MAMEIDISKFPQTRSVLIRFAKARWRCEVGNKDVHDCISQGLIDGFAVGEYFRLREELLVSLRNDGFNDIADKLDEQVCYKTYRDACPSDDNIMTLEDGDIVSPEDTRAAEISHRFWEQMKADEYEIYQLGLHLRDDA